MHSPAFLLRPFALYVNTACFDEMWGSTAFLDRFLPVGIVVDHLYLRSTLSQHIFSMTGYNFKRQPLTA